MTNDERHTRDSLEGLRRIEQSLIRQVEELQGAVPVDQSAVGEVIKQLKVITDLLITKQWILEIQDAIRRNPANALPPGAMQGSVAQRFAQLAGISDKKSKQDARKSSTPKPLYRTLPDGRIIRNGNA